MVDYRRIRNDLLALVAFAAIVFVGMSLFSYSPADPPSGTVFPQPAKVQNWCGPMGARVALGLTQMFGVGAWLVLLGLISIDVQLFSRRQIRDRFSRQFGGLLILFACCCGAQMLIPGVTSGPIYGSGGYVGALGSTLLQQEFSRAGGLVLTFSMFGAGLLLASETFVIRVVTTIVAIPLARLKPIVTRFTDRWAEKRRLRLERKALKAEEKAREKAYKAELKLAAAEEKTIAVVEERSEIRVNPPVILQKIDAPAEILRVDLSHELDDEEEGEDYDLPEREILSEAEDFPYELLAEKAKIAAETLEQTFQEFNLNIKVVAIDTGPVITQFELELEKGLRLNKVTALADDLAIALRVPSVRVVAPIPGRNTVGVEVPNEKQVMVRLRELIENSAEAIAKQSIPIFLGKDVSGHPLTMDMAKMPHLLIAGRTGTGKSVCLNTLILSILMTRTPEQVRMLMIDPKMVELSPYKKVPHLMHPVITDMKKAEAALSWAVEKMEERYALLARTGVRHLDSYNKLGKAAVLEKLGIDSDSVEAEDIPVHMPYIVIIADEMADMMMTSGKDVEGHIIRLAQKSRAVGIHLVLATQKPTVDVITGLIKSNLPARISFQVASRTDSRVVLDEMGADKLLGNGDMLFLAPGTSNLTRAQGTFVSDDEVNDVIEFYDQYEPQYSEELKQLGKGSGAAGPGGAGDRIADDMYDAAIEVVIREGRGSVSLLQRALGIGYGRAARLVDYMAEDGIVGDYNGSQAREVQYTLEEWEALKSGGEMAEV